MFGTSVIAEARDKSPGDGKIAGYGKIHGREAACVANDFTVMGASSAATNMKKIGQMKRAAVSRGMPLVFLGESSGARMPDNMGARGMGSLLGNDPHQYLRLRESPWVSAALGLCYGSSTWYALPRGLQRDAQRRDRRGVEFAACVARDRTNRSMPRNSAAGACMPT